MKKTDKEVRQPSVNLRTLLTGGIVVLVLGGGCAFRGRTNALNNADAMFKLSTEYGKETTTIIDADQQAQAQLADLITKQGQEASVSEVWSIYRERADAYADNAIYRPTSPKSRVGALETLLVEAARTAVMEIRKAEQINRNRKTTLLEGLAKIELQKRELNLVQKKMKLLASRDDLLRQIAFYLGFAADIEEQIRDGSSSGSNSQGP